MEPLCTTDGNKCAATVENSVTVPQKVKNRITTRSSTSTWGYMPQRMESHAWKRDLGARVHSTVGQSS